MGLLACVPPRLAISSLLPYLSLSHKHPVEAYGNSRPADMGSPLCLRPPCIILNGYASPCSAFRIGKFHLCFSHLLLWPLPLPPILCQRRKSLCVLSRLGRAYHPLELILPLGINSSSSEYMRG